jgi:environmental stress-induced protein Ves
MRHLRPSDYKIMPWKNGGGTTTEIAIFPERADLGAFDWRVSIAEVLSEGPFSRFPGYDRTIMLLKGMGMILDAGCNGLIELRETFQPQPFPGEWSVTGRPLGGPALDFNMIVRRGHARGEVEVIAMPETLGIACPAGGWLIAHVLTGNLNRASAGDTLLADHDLKLDASDEPALIVVARIGKSEDSS